MIKSVHRGYRLLEVNLLFVEIIDDLLFFVERTRFFFKKYYFIKAAKIEKKSI